jgi:hypothetical protein
MERSGTPGMHNNAQIKDWKHHLEVIASFWETVGTKTNNAQTKAAKTVRNLDAE